MKAITNVKKFWHKQTRNYKVFLARGVLEALSAGGTESEYWNIFVSRLGATTVELGIINSISHLMTALLALPSGWITDRNSKMKRLYLWGKGLALPTVLMRFLVQTWPVCILIDLWQSITERIMGPSSEIIWISSLTDGDRVKGLSLHTTIISFAGIIAPLLAAYIVTFFGGLESADNIRPLFFMQFIINLIAFFLLVTQLQEVSFERSVSKTSVYNYFFNVLNEVDGLKLLLLRQSIQTLISHMRMPFSGLYMVDVKGATALILGWRGTISTALMVFLSIPAGVLVDHFGRRKLAYFSRIFWWVAILITILTPSDHPEYLIIASVLQGIQSALFIGWTAFYQEFIPLDIRGRWNGLSMLSHGIIGTIAPIIGGFIWNINPDYIWWINLFGDALIVLPLMILIPDRTSRYLDE